MFKVRFHTLLYRPDVQISLRAQQWQNWTEDLAGNYENDAWVFVLDDGDFAGGLTFKFVLEKQVWMNGPNLFLQPQPGAEYDFYGTDVIFEQVTEAIVQNSAVQQKFLVPQLDESILYDVVVIGSGFGGGIVAEQAAEWVDINAIQNAILTALGAQALPGGNLVPKLAALGGVAHEVGSLRMGAAGADAGGAGVTPE